MQDQIRCVRRKESRDMNESEASEPPAASFLRRAYRSAYRGRSRHAHVQQCASAHVSRQHGRVRCSTAAQEATHVNALSPITKSRV